MRMIEASYEIQNGHLHHTLIEVRRPVLDNLDRNNLLGPEILALDNLSKRSLAQNVQNEVAVPATVRLWKTEKTNILVSRVFRAQNIIHIENIIALLVVIAIILHTLAGLGQNPPRVPGRFIFEAGITDSVGRR